MIWQDSGALPAGSLMLPLRGFGKVDASSDAADPTQPSAARTSEGDQTEYSMTKRRIESFAKSHLLPELAGFAVAQGLVYKPPLLPVLRGFAFDDSDFNSEIVYL